LIALLSMFYTAIVLLKTLIDVIRLGPAEMFKKVNRNERPKVFDNKAWNHGFLQLSQIKMHYVQCGNREKPLMLFVHGFPDFWYSWRNQLKEFSKDYWCVAIDMRGYNESEKPVGIENYHMKLLAQDINECVQKLGRESCILVAHDWGGVVAWSVARLYPAIVEKLIILNCPHSSAMSKHLYSSYKQMFKSWYMFFFQFPCVPEFILGLRDYIFLDECFLTDIKNKKAFSNEDIEAWKYVWSKKNAFTPAIHYYRAVFQMDRVKMPKDLIASPTLIIWGTDDMALDTCMAEMSAKYCKNATVRLVNGASHWVQQDNPELCNKYMFEFLNQHN